MRQTCTTSKNNVEERTSQQEGAQSAIMAELSQDLMINADRSDAHGVSTVATDLTGIRGKIIKYDVLKKLHDVAVERRKQAADELTEADAEYQVIKTDYSQLSAELTSLKEHSPEAKAVLADFTPFEDIQPDDAAPLLPAEPHLNVTKKILMAVNEIKDLEHRNEAMKVMLKEKTAEVERLTEKLKHSECDIKMMEDRISHLNAEIAELKAGMSPEESSASLTATGDVQLSAPDTPSLILTEPYSGEDVVVDPAVMQDKIKQLSFRITELVNHNRQWKQQCDELMRQVEAANQQLVEYKQLTEQQLQEERAKTDRAVAERDDALAEVERERMEKREQQELCRHLAEEVERLETTVRDMESHRLTFQNSEPNDESLSEQLALKCQIEEFQRDLEAERQSHERTKANSDSLSKQWTEVFQALRAKTKELAVAKAEIEKLKTGHQRCQSQLKEANKEKELIAGRLNGHDRELSAVSSSSMSKPVRRGTLEEDRPIAVNQVRIEDRSEQCIRWICDVCSYYNTDRQSLNSCKMCMAKRGTTVKHPVQESHTSLAYSGQGALKATSINSSRSGCSTGNRSIGGGRSRLEEDGAMMPRAMHAVY